MNPWTLSGAGAIGGLLACQLSDAAIPVRLALRPTKPDAAGISPPPQRSIELVRGETSQTYTFPTLQPEDVISHLILTTKTWQSREALAAIRAQIANDAVILVLQNGMGTADWLTEQFPEATLLAGTTTHGAYREAPNRVIHAGKGDIWIGPLRTQDATVGNQILGEWQQREMQVSWDEAIIQRLWLKLGINCAINPLTVLYDCRNGELLDNAEALETMALVCEEFTQVYKAHFQREPAENLFALAKNVARQTAANISSMRQDVLKGNPTEIDAINGYLVQQARCYGVYCPANEKILTRLSGATTDR